MQAYIRINSESQEVELRNVRLPTFQADEVLVQVKAFGVGIHDRYFIPKDVDFPYVIGSEGAGIIQELGTQVQGFEVGQRVIFTTILQPQGGSWAEFAVAKQSSLIPLPENVSFAQGAAIPIAGTTALECIGALALKKGNTLFIAGASGAIGTLVIQLASSKGIRVSASASAKNHSYMMELGAEKAVDYQDEHWTAEIIEWASGGVNAALAIQPGTGTDSIKVVADGGKLITVSGDHLSVIPERTISVEQMPHTMETRQLLVDLVYSVSEGKIVIILEKEYQFEHALEALKKTETRHARGKLIVNGLS